MALCWVRVERRDGKGGGDPFYIDGNYVDVAGRIGRPVKVRTGERLFEMFGPDDQIAWHKRQICEGSEDNSKAKPFVVTLDPVKKEAAP